MPKKVDSSKKARHDKLEESMHDTIGQHSEPIGPVDMSEVAALHRKLGVETNMQGEPFTPGELITAAGIVMEETGAEPMLNRADYMKEESQRRARIPSKPTYFFMGSFKGK